MLFALALQAARPDNHDGPVARQVIVVPAINLSIARTISPAHPRQTWKVIPYSLDTDVWGRPGVSKALTSQWADQHDQRWTIASGDVPVLFHVTDDEAHDLLDGEIPRNVTLRYQRAIAAHNATLVGAGARSLDDVRADFQRGISDGVLTIAKAPAGDGTTNARLVETLSRVNTAIENDKHEMLSAYVPDAARAKGAGPHRPHGALPERSGGGAFAAEPDAAPAPAFVAAPAGAGDEVKAGAALTRPNGMTYYARPIPDLDVKVSDVEYFRKMHAAGVHTLLWGPPGTGKTASLEVAHEGMVTMIGTPETEAQDFLGTYVAVVDPESGRESLRWEDGPLVLAMERGKVLFVDEIGLIPSNQIAPLLAIMDGRETLTIPTNPARGTIRVHEGFGVVGAFNPSTARNMSEALLSRFGAKIAHTTDFTVARKMGVNSRLVDAAEHMWRNVESGELGASPQMRELLQFAKDETLLGTVYALRNLLNNAPEMERDVWTTILREKFGDIPGANKKIRGLSLG